MLSNFVLLSCSVTNEPTCEINNWGIISNETFTHNVKDKSKFSGEAAEHSGIIIKKTTIEIPLVKDISFGIEHSFKNIAPEELIKVKVTHPLFIKKDGSTSKQTEHYIKTANIGTSWQLNREWELVEGKWIFEYVYNNKVLCSKEFTTKL